MKKYNFIIIALFITTLNVSFAEGIEWKSAEAGKWRVIENSSEPIVQKHLSGGHGFCAKKIKSGEAYCRTLAIVNLSQESVYAYMYSSGKPKTIKPNGATGINLSPSDKHLANNDVKIVGAKSQKVVWVTNVFKKLEKSEKYGILISR